MTVRVAGAIRRKNPASSSAKRSTDTWCNFRKIMQSTTNVIITWHVVLHAIANFLRKIRLTLQYAIPLRVRPIITQLSFGREKAFPLLLGYRDYRRGGSRYSRSNDNSGLLAWRDRERKIGDLRRLHGIVEQHL